MVFFWLCLVVLASNLIMHHMSSATVNWSNQRSNVTSNPDDAIIHDHLNQVISEEEALQYKPCKDINLAANANLSTLRILGSPNKVYNIGDKIFALTTLFDSYGKQKTTGGDHVRARIYNDDLEAYASGAVYDHNNGSYTLIFEALWSGESKISATIAYTKEAIIAQYRLTATNSLRQILAKYKRETYEEDALCDSDNNRLIKTTNTDICNFTSRNSGMPWFCGKPRNSKLKCTDWKFVKYLRTRWHALVSKCERELLTKRFHRVLTKEVKVVVKEHTQNSSSKIIKYYQPSISCVNYNISKLWFEKYTSGFFFNMQWKLRHCEGFHRDNFQKCLRNKRLYLIGDSTVRQWYDDIRKRYKCEQFTEELIYANRFKPSGCIVASNNFTVTMTWHSQPLYVTPIWTDPKFTLISVTKQLERIGTNEEAIVLIHVFLHNTYTLSKPYRDKMVNIQAAVETLLKRNDKVKIFIKLPHTFTGVDTRFGARNDFYGFSFSSIIFQTFRWLHDKVIVLDNKDATNSIASGGLHPGQTIVSSMVDQMFSYVCK